MTRARPHPCTGQGRSSARRINGKPSALGHLVSGQPQTSPQLALIRPRRLATSARSIVGRSVHSRRSQRTHGRLQPGTGACRGKNRRDRTNAFCLCAPDAPGISAYSGFSESRFYCQRRRPW